MLIGPRWMAIAKKLQSRPDVSVCRVQFGGSGVCIKSICGLVVARFVLQDLISSPKNCGQSDRFLTYKCPKVIPHFGNVRIQTYGARIGVKCITILIDLVVEDSDGAPEGRISPIAIDGLLVSFICFGKFLLCHVAAAQEIPALGI